MEDQAELVSGCHRGQDDSSRRAARHVEAGGFDGCRGQGQPRRLYVAARGGGFPHREGCAGRGRDNGVSGSDPPLETCSSSTERTRSNFFLAGRSERRRWPGTCARCPGLLVMSGRGKSALVDLKPSDLRLERRCRKPKFRGGTGNPRHLPVGLGQGRLDRFLFPVLQGLSPAR